jgi:hypothetical protein
VLLTVEEAAERLHIGKTKTYGFLAVSSGFGDQVCVVPAWRVDEGVRVSLAA